MTLIVTLRDAETGETQTKELQDREYLLITHGDCYIASTQIYPKSGTQVLTVKRGKP